MAQGQRDVRDTAQKHRCNRSPSDPATSVYPEDPAPQCEITGTGRPSWHYRSRQSHGDVSAMLLQGWLDPPGLSPQRGRRRSWARDLCSQWCALRGGLFSGKHVTEQGCHPLGRNQQCSSRCLCHDPEAGTGQASYHAPHETGWNGRPAAGSRGLGPEKDPGEPQSPHFLPGRTLGTTVRGGRARDGVVGSLSDTGVGENQGSRDLWGRRSERRLRNARGVP